MKRILYTILALCITLLTYGQTNPKVKEMTSQRAKIEQEISESQRLLTSAKKDVDGQLAQLSALTAQIKKQQQYVDRLNADVRAIDKEMKAIEEQLTTLRLELERRHGHYAKALQLMANKNSFENRLMFLLSADTFNQMVRRMRYLREYSEFQRKQGEQLVQQQKELDNKQAELEDTRKEKQILLTKRIEEKKVLDKQVAEQKQLIAGLKKKQKDISNRIAKQQKERNKLNEEIERIIKAEIAAQKKEPKKEEEKPQDTQASGKEMPVYRESSSEKRLTGSFESNKGRLPSPITGPYLITSHYGINYVEGLKNVKFNNHGVDLQGKEGCSAKAIFDGTVSYVFQHMQNEGAYIVMVRHGQYISAYFNITNLKVKKGDKVKANESLGTICVNATGNYVMQFQLRKDTQSLNPELWLAL